MFAADLPVLVALFVAVEIDDGDVCDTAAIETVEREAADSSYTEDEDFRVLELCKIITEELAASIVSHSHLLSRSISS